jgi:hypothetical protein
MIATIFFPAAHTIGTVSDLHGAVTLSADRFAQRNFGDAIQRTCREPLAAQHLSGNCTAFDFVSRQ